MRTTTKICAVCGAVFEGTGGRAKYCPDCRAEQYRKVKNAAMASSYAKDPERYKAQQRMYSASHKEQRAASMGAYYQAHREEILAKQAARRGEKRRPEGGKDPELRKRELKEYQRAYYMAHRGAEVAKRKAEREAEKQQKED